MTTLIFSIFNSLVIIFWGFLIFIPKNKFTKVIVNYPYIPIIFSFGYLFFLVQVPDIFKADFSSLYGVLNLFKNSTLESAAAGWIHYLAFDFWMGAWILKNSQKINIPHYIILFPLIFTFILGPFGILIYFIFSKIYLKITKNE